MGIYARDSGVWKNVTGGDPSSPAIVSGGTVSTYTDSGITYQVNTFTSDGTLNVSSPGTADVFLIGGGGAGGGSAGGGGGAGGTSLNTIQTINLTAKAYPVTVGAGGIGYDSFPGASGTQSSIGPIIGVGGGGGGGTTGAQPALNGGCGGGAQGTNPTATATGGLVVQAGGGFKGGDVTPSAGYPAGGGGGLGSVGGNSSGQVAGAGGTFLSVNITGTAVEYGGGGGGGVYLVGGGTPNTGGGAGAGDGSDVYNGIADSASIPNRGSGGGGSGYLGQGGDGASGVVIVRYKI